MNVLMISGDKDLDANAPERLALQRSQVERLDVAGYTGIESAVPGFFGVLRLAIRNRYDVITVQEPFWRGLLAWFAARLTCAKLNLQVHADLTGQSLVKRMLARFVLRRADSVRAVSERVRQQVESIGIRASVCVLPICIELEPLRALTRKPHDTKTILWIGRFEREKDPMLAVSVLERVRAAVPAVRLIMLGAGSMEQALRERAAGLPVEFPGWQDPKPYLQTADIVISTSLHESWGASIVEALAAGVPVVAPDVGVAREAGAIVVDRDKLDQAVIDMFEHPQKGELKLRLLPQNEWAAQWRATLLP